MTPMNPPSLATWLLEHLTPGPRNEALAGDLLEEFATGRPATWYWRQTLAAIAIACSRQILSNRAAMLFTTLWSTFVPAWLLAIANLETHFNLNQRFGQMDWPWSILSDWGLLLAANLLFIWSGIALYLIPHLWAAGNLKFRSFMRAILASVPILIALWAALVVLPKLFLMGLTDPHASPGAPWMHNMHIAAILVRLPFFLTVLCTLWGAASRLHHRPKGFAASSSSPIALNRRQDE
jgi:hypothetical protein